MVGCQRCPQRDGDDAQGGARTMPRTGMMPMAGRGSPPACREAAARSTYQQPAKGGSVYPLTDFFLLTEPGSWSHPTTRDPSGTACSQPPGLWTKPRLPGPGPAPAPATLPAALWHPGMCREGTMLGTLAGWEGHPSWGPWMLSRAQPHEEEEDARPHEEDAQPCSPQLGLPVELGTLRYGGPWRGEQPHAMGPGPAPRQHWDPERLQHPNISPPQAAPLPLEEGRAENGPDTSNGKSEPGRRGAHRRPRHKAALDAAPPLARTARSPATASPSSSSSHPARALGALSNRRAVPGHGEPWGAPQHLPPRTQRGQPAPGSADTPGKGRASPSRGGCNPRPRGEPNSPQGKQ